MLAQVSDMPVPGEVHYLPPDSVPGGDPKTRRHVLLSACPTGAEAATLAFASTKPTEASFGATHILLNPFATRYQRTGFDEATYIFPGRLFTVDMADLGAPIGQIVHELPRMLRALSAALGLGSGTWATGTASGSLRGRLVELSGALADHGTRYALIVTEARYSLQQRYQTVIPIFDGNVVQATANDVVAENASWLRELGGMEQAVFAAPDVFSLWHRAAISRPLSTGVGESTMNAIDECLRRHFGL